MERKLTQRQWKNFLAAMAAIGLVVFIFGLYVGVAITPAIPWTYVHMNDGYVTSVATKKECELVQRAYIVGRYGTHWHGGMIDTCEHDTSAEYYLETHVAPPPVIIDLKNDDDDKGKES